MLEQRQITLTVNVDSTEVLRHAAAMLRALAEILPIALAEARLHLRHEARELGQLARMIEREVEDG